MPNDIVITDTVTGKVTIHQAREFPKVQTKPAKQLLKALFLEIGNGKVLDEVQAVLSFFEWAHDTIQKKEVINA